MKFREKNKEIMKLKPDVIVIQECENVNYFKYINHDSFEYKWYGENKNKGIGIFVFNQKIIKENLNNENKYIVEIETNSQIFKKIFAIWAMNDELNNKKRYISQIGSYLTKNKNKIDEDSIILGDFNSNKIWDNDKPLKEYNHTDVTNILSEINMHSVYHTTRNEEFGEEKENTFYLYRNENKKFHIDYCFCHKSKLNIIKSFEICDYNTWKKYSDHMPIVIDTK